MSRVYVGLGSNLDQPRQQLLRAFQELAELPRTQLKGRSSLWASAPMGPADQPDYLNAAALLETSLEPMELLDRLQAIEAAHHRRRERRWGPRTLDLDLLLYDERILDLPRLKIPHPGLHQRDFVLAPLLELDPGLEIPGRGGAAELLQACPVRTARRIE